MQRGHSMKVAPGHSAPTSESDDPAAVGFNRHLQFSRSRYGFPRQSALHPTPPSRRACILRARLLRADCMLSDVVSTIGSSLYFSSDLCQIAPAVRRDSAHSLSGATLSKDLSFFPT